MVSTAKWGGHVSCMDPYNWCSNVLGANWKHVEGFIEGQTTTSCNKFEDKHCAFAHPIDVHLACRGIQGWPKIHLEVYAVNALNQCWPVG